MGCGRCWKPLQPFTGFKQKQPCTVSLRSSCGRQVVPGASHFPDVLWKSYLLSTQRVFEFHVLGPKSGLGQPNYLLGISRLQLQQNQPPTGLIAAIDIRIPGIAGKGGTCASAIPTVPGVGNAKNRKGPWGSKKGRGTHVCIALFRESGPHPPKYLQPECLDDSSTSVVQPNSECLYTANTNDSCLHVTYVTSYVIQT